MRSRLSKPVSWFRAALTALCLVDFDEIIGSVVNTSSLAMLHVIVLEHFFPRFTHVVTDDDRILGIETRGFLLLIFFEQQIERLDS